MIPYIVYFLCIGTSLTAAILLFKNFFRSQVRLLLWSGICFFLMALSNGLLFLDMMVVHGMDLSVYRTVPAVLGFAALMYGCIWEVM